LPPAQSVILKITTDLLLTSVDYLLVLPMK